MHLSFTHQKDILYWISANEMAWLTFEHTWWKTHIDFRSISHLNHSVRKQEQETESLSIILYYNPGLDAVLKENQITPLI